MTLDPKKKTIHFHLEVEASLSLEEMFPDGIPNDVSIHHVVSAIKQDGGPRNILQEWDLLQRPSMDVSAMGAHATVDWDGDIKDLRVDAGKTRISFNNDETCDECEAPMQNTGSMIGPYHYTHCSLYPDNAIK